MPTQSSLFSLVTIVGVLFLLTSIVNAQSPEPKSKPNGSISGRVLIDGKPAVAIPVAAVAGESINRPDATARAVTDIEGQYRLSGLTAGQYQVLTLCPGMIAEPVGFPNYYSSYGAIKNILLGTDEEVANVDLKLIRGAVITGRITKAEDKPVVDEHVSLQILDQNDKPLFGALGGRNDEMYATDDRGIYRIYGLAPGRYKVSAGYDAASDGIIRGQRYEKTFYLDPNDQSKAGIVELREGDEAKNIDIRLQPAEPTITISGRVIDGETRLPIAKAGLQFMLVPKGKESPPPGFIMQADDRGEFTFSGFSPGRYAVSASSEFYGGNFYGDPVYVEVTDKDVTGIEIKAVPGLSLSGFIAADELSTKELLGLLRNLTVAVSGVSPSNNQFRTGGRAVVAPDGSFQVDGLRPGPVSIFVSTPSPTFIRATISRMERDGAAVNQGFDLQQSVSGLRIVLEYGTGAIRGTVKVEGDPSINYSRMFVLCKREGARENANAQVDARGHFFVKNLAPGTYEVTIQIGGGSPSNPHRPIPPQKQVVNVTNGAESETNFVIDLTPKPGGP